jgi:hypothetical protein
MQKRVRIKHKILLLIILGIAAGFILLLPHKNIINKISQVTPNVSEKKDIYTKCEGPNKTYSKILAQNEIDLTDKTCLYVGCGGFSY